MMKKLKALRQWFKQKDWQFMQVRKFSVSALINSFTSGAALIAMLVHINLGGSGFSVMLATVAFIISSAIVLAEIIFRWGANL